MDGRYFLINADWAYNYTGKKEFVIAPVIRSIGFLPCGEEMIEVQMPDGRSWTVWCEPSRGEFYEHSGTITYRKRRGKKMHFLMGGPTFKDACKYIAWDRVERNESGETLYQYFWIGNGETKELSEHMAEAIADHIKGSIAESELDV